MNKTLALAVLVSFIGLAGCATTDVEPASKTGASAPKQEASPKSDDENLTGSRLPRRKT